MDRKRLFRTVLAVAVTLCIGAHCTAAPVEVVFWHPFDSGTPRDAIEELIEVFNASRDDIRVVGQVVPDLIEKVRVAVIGGSPPDVATNLYPWREGAIGMLTDLTPFAERDGLSLEEEFFPAGIPEAYYGGVLYGLPWFHVVHPVLFYRIDAYERAGLDGNSPPATWEELRALSTRLTQRSAEGVVTQLNFDWGKGAAENAFPMYYRVAGGEYVDPTGTRVIVNNDLARRVLNFLVEVREEIQSDLAVAVGTFYTGGRVHMLNGNWMAPNIQSGYPHLVPGVDWAMAPFPVPEGSPQQTVMSSRYMTIPKGAPNADAAWEFIKWLTGPEASRLYSLRRNLLPAHRDAVGDPAFADAFLFWDVQQAMLSHGIPEWGTVPIPDVANFLSVMELAYTKGLTRTVSPESALEEAARLMQAFLDEHLAD